jgi:hypothetical protein
MPTFDATSAVASFHAWAAVASGILLAAIVIAAVLDATGVRSGRRVVDGLILALIVATAAAALAGPILAVGGKAPLDPMHVLYGVVAVVAVPLARLAGARSPRRANAWIITGSLVTVGVLLRLWATGS